MRPGRYKNMFKFVVGKMGFFGVFIWNPKYNSNVTYICN